MFRQWAQLPHTNVLDNLKARLAHDSISRPARRRQTHTRFEVLQRPVNALQ